MADSFIQMPADGTGKKVRTQTRVVGTDTVHESYVINTDETTGNTARVLNAIPAATDYGLLVRRIDPARTPKTFLASGVAGTTTDALLTLTPVTNFVNGTNATTHAVASGKTLRLMGLTISQYTTAATANWTRVFVRCNPSGVVANTSPVVVAGQIPGTAAAANTGATAHLDFPDGIDIPFGSGAQIGISAISLATTSVITVSLVGYEY